MAGSVPESLSPSIPQAQHHAWLRAGLPAGEIKGTHPRPSLVVGIIRGKSPSMGFGT